jgi:hypothetical protein
MPIILATWEADMGRILVPGQAWQKKSVRPHLDHQKLGMVILTCHPSCIGSINRRIAVQAGLGVNMQTYSKNKVKRLGAWLK